MRELATSPTRLLEDMAGYMNGVHAQRVDDLATKREREARRRRMLVEQQAAAHEAERKAEAEALLQELARTVAEEQQVAAQLWQTAQDKEVSLAFHQRKPRRAERVCLVGAHTGPAAAAFVARRRPGPCASCASGSTPSGALRSGTRRFGASWSSTRPRASSTTRKRRTR